MKIVARRTGGLGDETADERLPQLARWGARLGGLGIAPGAAGNMSVRTPRGFLITRTEVALAAIELRDWVLVTGLHRRKDGILEVTFHGDRTPSRDSFVHGTVYQRVPAANAVFHVHDRDVLSRAARLGLPCTEQHFPAGTSESVAEIERLLARSPVDFFVLVEHGVVAWAPTVDEAGYLVEGWHERAGEGE